ncbi:MAG: hypothetical protein LBB47_06665, partial [Spirochaetaceae bacterium]|nr:hypothetical protein [Spirochaetaceae bacterium]
MFKKFHITRQNIARSFIIFCVIYYFPASAANFAKTIYDKLYLTRFAGADGLGGMDYSEKEIEQIVSVNSEFETGLVEGVPEPEEFS